MKITDLIHKLQEASSKYGDKEIFSPDGIASLPEDVAIIPIGDDVKFEYLKKNTAYAKG